MGHAYTQHLENTVARYDAKIAVVRTVITKLELTIAGKQQLLDDKSYYSGDLVNDVTQRFLQINVNELTLILNDLKSIEP